MGQEVGRHQEQKLLHPDVAVNMFLFSEVAWDNFLNRKVLNVLIKMVELISLAFTPFHTIV